MMKILVLVLCWAAAASGELPCDDEALSCNDLRTAHDCGVVSACVEQHWESLQAGQRQPCEWCRLFVEYAHARLANPELQRVILLGLENACMLLSDSDLASQCVLTVENNFNEVLRVVMVHLSPEMCEAMGWCPAEVTRRDADTPRGRDNTLLLIPQKIVGDLLRRKRSGWNASSDSDLVCVVCKNFIEDLKAIIVDPHNKLFFRNVLWKTCQCIYEEYRRKCMEAVEIYLDIVLDLIANELNPNQLCESLGVCRHRLDVPMDAMEPKCMLCSSVVAKAKEITKNVTNDAEIEELLKDVCLDLPENLVARCRDFVDSHTELLKYLLARNQSPLDVCFILNLCSSQAYTTLTTLVSLVPSDHCEWCQGVVRRVRDARRRHSDQYNLVDEVCEPYDIQCRGLAESYGPRIHEELAQGLEPQAICTGFCSNFNFNVRCTLGPLYWCSSRAAASDCDAALFCEQNLWSKI